MDVKVLVLFQLSFWSLAGFLAGYALKKIAKIFMVLLGLAFIAILYLQYTGFIVIHFDKILQSMQALNWVLPGNFIPSYIISAVPFTGSFLAGFGLGIKKG